MTSIAPPVNRVFTYLKDSQSPIEFHKCLVRLLGSKTETVKVNVQLLNGRLIISSSEENGVILKHPTFCPMLDPSPHFNSNRNVIDVGVCGLLETRDEYLLLTRRSKNLRTFPGCWVPPGGAVDLEDDSLLNTCMRELIEETGLKDLDLESPRMLCFWESVYPYKSSYGSPKRHHLVIYYLLKSKKSKEEIKEQFHLQEEEVDAVAWIHSSLAYEVTCIGSISKENDFMDILLLQEQELKSKKISSAQFFNLSSSGSNDSERITTGTLFSISQWALTKFPTATPNI